MLFSSLFLLAISSFFWWMKILGMTQKKLFCEPIQSCLWQSFKTFFSFLKVEEKNLTPQKCHFGFCTVPRESSNFLFDCVESETRRFDDERFLISWKGSAFCFFTVKCHFSSVSATFCCFWCFFAAKSVPKRSSLLPKLSHFYNFFLGSVHQPNWVWLSKKVWNRFQQLDSTNRVKFPLHPTSFKFSKVFTLVKSKISE